MKKDLVADFLDIYVGQRSVLSLGSVKDLQMVYLDICGFDFGFFGNFF